jgi:hypothetical protein
VLEIVCPEIQHFRRMFARLAGIGSILSRRRSYSLQQFDMQSRPGASSTAQVLVKPFLETETFE